MKKKTKINFAGFASILLIAGIGLGLVAIPQPSGSSTFSLGVSEGDYIFEIDHINYTLAESLYNSTDNPFENYSVGLKKLYRIGNITSDVDIPNDYPSFAPSLDRKGDLLQTNWTSDLNTTNATWTPNCESCCGCELREVLYWSFDIEAMSNFTLRSKLIYTGIPKPIDLYLSNIINKNTTLIDTKNNTTIQFNGDYHGVNLLGEFTFNKTDGYLEKASYSSIENERIFSYSRI